MNEWNDDDLFNLFELVYDLGQFTKMIMGLHVVGYSLYTEYNLEKQITIFLNSKIESGKTSLLFEYSRRVSAAKLGVSNENLRVSKKKLSLH